MALLAVVVGAGVVGTVPVSVALADVPMPRLAPRSGVVAASFAPTALAPEMGPVPPLPLAIEHEVRVDVSAAVAALYAERGHRPVWDDTRAAALRARLAQAAGDGLDPVDYAVPRAVPGVFGRAAEDVALTEAALRYLRHAHAGRLAPSTVSRLITLSPPPLDERVALRRLAAAEDIADALERAHPPDPRFQALRAQLRARLAERAAEPEPVVVGPGPNLRQGVREPRVALLRARLGATVRRGSDPTVFDDALAQAVMDFQRAEGLGADGIVGPRTLARLDAGRRRDDIAALVANMERWRWMPRRLGVRHVMVNIPAYRVEVVAHGQTTFAGRVIVGTPSSPTPLFSDEIEHIVVNPYWNVPYSIAANEMLGAIRANPSGYLARRGYEVVVGGRVVNPSSLAWNRDTLRRVRIRQRPGRSNALGAVKFLFPNPHAVYLHDTPNRHLFERERRAFSHGCVRVQDPFALADALLVGERLSGEGLRRMVGGGQKWLNLERPVRVHLAYFTREVTADGELVRHGDIYGFDRRIAAQLGL